MDYYKEIFITYEDNNAIFYNLITENKPKKLKNLKDFHLLFDGYISTSELIISNNYFFNQVNQYDYKYKAIIHNFIDFSIVIYKSKTIAENYILTDLFIIVLGNDKQIRKLKYFNNCKESYCNDYNLLFKNDKILNQCFGYYNYIFINRIEYSFPYVSFKTSDVRRFLYSNSTFVFSRTYDWINSKVLNLKYLTKLSIEVIKNYDHNKLHNLFYYCKNNESLINILIYGLLFDENKIIDEKLIFTIRIFKVHIKEQKFGLIFMAIGWKIH